MSDRHTNEITQILEFAPSHLGEVIKILEAAHL
jgi:hypothetical protein